MSKKLRFVIVDDSMLSRTMIRDVIEDSGRGWTVIGEAGCSEDAIALIRKDVPDIVTMDIAMPGDSGLVCISKLKIEFPHLKFILMSSMRDDALIKEARKLNINSYLQKPWDEEEFFIEVEKNFSVNSAFDVFLKKIADAALDYTIKWITKMTKEEDLEVEYLGLEEERLTEGAFVILGITGKFYSGRIIIDMEVDTAINVLEAFLKRPVKAQDENIRRARAMEMVAELTNIIAGNTCSVLNQENKEANLRVALPGMFYGKKTLIPYFNMKSHGFVVKSSLGKMYLNVGFKGEV